MNYSQNDEQSIILNYFKNKTGSVLDLGANDGVALSNSLAVIEKGWTGVLVEASPSTFKRLEQNLKFHSKTFKYNVAVGCEEESEVTFYESGPLLGKDDRSLVSTINPEELKRWPKIKFTEITVPCVPIKKILEDCPVKTFDLISIDIEGMDYDVLTQLNLEQLECKMLIVEFNGKDPNKYIRYCMGHGMKLHAQNQENLIFTR
jgi:FkbM family methyltransferase